MRLPVVAVRAFIVQYMDELEIYAEKTAGWPWMETRMSIYHFEKRAVDFLGRPLMGEL